MSGSASFHSVKKSWYAIFAPAVSCESAWVTMAVLALRIIPLLNPLWLSAKSAASRAPYWQDRVKPAFSGIMVLDFFGKRAINISESPARKTPTPEPQSVNAEIA
jgi:hypothetical protein